MASLPQAPAALAEAVFRKRPGLKEILSVHGDTTLFAYAEALPENTFAVTSERKQEFISAVANKTLILLGEKTAEAVTRHLNRFYTVSTADHHGPLTHPYFVNANVLSAAPFASEASAYESQIVLATSNVSFGNSSLPRSALFHTRARLEPVRANLISARYRAAPVYGFPAYTKDDLAKMMHDVRVETGDQNLLSLLEKIYGHPDALTQTTYADQVTVTNGYLWKEFFGHSSVELPLLSYLSLEDIVVRLLIDSHLNTETECNEMLFNPQTRATVEKEFDGIPAGFTKNTGVGTFLFWYQPLPTGKRIALSNTEDALVSRDGTYRVPCTPEAIRQGLEQGTLIPSTLLSLTLLSCYYGVKCLGGFSQTTYLRLMQQAYARVFSRTDFPEASSMGSNFLVAFLSRAKFPRVSATGLDLALYGDQGSWERFVEAAKTLTLRESLELRMPDFYRMLYSEQERDPALLRPTSEELIADLRASVPSTLLA